MTYDPNEAPDGRGALREHLGTAEPPAALADRVHRTLEARGLVRHGPSRARVWAARAGLLAAGVLIGLVARSSSRPDPVAGPNIGQRYVLLLYGDPVDDTGAVHAAREREYGQWASSLTNGVTWVGGYELGEVVADIPPAGPTPLRNDRLAGYFEITGGSRDRVAEAARSVPHVAYGGRAVLMAVER
jgi:hypothetical protein